MKIPLLFATITIEARREPLGIPFFRCGNCNRRAWWLRKRMCCPMGYKGFRLCRKCDRELPF